jgi:hypothetical protein
VDFNLETSSALIRTSQPPIEVTINFPTYDGVKNIQLGFVPGSEILPPSQFKNPDPIGFYGSSITQGGCASRPGNAYTNILGRRMDAPGAEISASAVPGGVNGCRPCDSGAENDCFSAGL